MRELVKSVISKKWVSYGRGSIEGQGRRYDGVGWMRRARDLE